MRHLEEVYKCLGMCIVTITIGASLSISFESFQNYTMAFIGSLLCFLLLGLTPSHGTNMSLRMGYLLGFSASMGLLMGPFVNALIKSTPNILRTAFMVTFLIFVSLTACAMVSEKEHWLYLGGPLLTCLSFLVYLNIGNILFGGAFLLEQIDMYLGLPIMCGYVLYDTQLINMEVLQGNRDHVLHAMTLLINVIGIFIRVLELMSQWREDSKKI